MSDPLYVDRVRTFYDRFSPLFLEHAGSTFQTGLIKARADEPEDPAGSTLACARAAGLTGTERVLDAGCGVGGPARALLDAWPDLRLDAVTLSSVQAELAREQVAPHAARARIHVADYHALPFDDASFDIVFFFECTAYSPDPARMYAEAARVLRPGGRVYVKDVYREGRPLSPVEEEAMARFDELWACSRTGSLAEAAEAARSAGLDVSTRVYPHVGVARFLGSMIGAGGALNDFGRSFLRSTCAPIEYGELIAVR